jgi:hypothetical protein
MDFYKYGNEKFFDIFGCNVFLGGKEMSLAKKWKSIFVSSIIFLAPGLSNAIPGFGGGGTGAEYAMLVKIHAESVKTVLELEKQLSELKAHADILRDTDSALRGAAAWIVNQYGLNYSDLLFEPASDEEHLHMAALGLDYQSHADRVTYYKFMYPDSRPLNAKYDDQIAATRKRNEDIKLNGYRAYVTGYLSDENQDKEKEKFISTKESVKKSATDGDAAAKIDATNLALMQQQETMLQLMKNNAQQLEVLMMLADDTAEREFLTRMKYGTNALERIKK